MSVFTDWPGAGDVPEPEPEGFRDEQVAAERERLIQEEKDRLEASKALKDELSGKPEAPPPPEGGVTSRKSTSHTKDDDDRSTKSSKGSTSH